MAKAVEVKNGNTIEMGKPYYCTECKRNHTKGKIYKDHFEYAKFEDGEKKVNKNKQSEITEDDYDDEAELIEAFEELEEQSEMEYEYDAEDEEIDIDFDKRRMAFSIKQVENPVEDGEEEASPAAEEAKPEEAPEEQDSKEVQADADPEKPEEEAEADKPEEKAAEPAEEAPEENKDAEEPVADEKEKQIKEILKELKDEANLD